MLPRPADVGGARRPEARRRRIVAAAGRRSGQRVVRDVHGHRTASRCRAHDAVEQRGERGRGWQAPPNQAARLDHRDPLGPPEHQRLVQLATRAATAAARTPAPAARRRRSAPASRCARRGRRARGRRRLERRRRGRLERRQLLGRAQDLAIEARRNRRARRRVCRSASRSARVEERRRSAAAATTTSAPSGQRGDDRQGEVAADAIDARHHQADHRRDRRTRPARRRESPGRTRQVDVEPAVAERGAARREALLQPAVPRADERVGRRGGAENRRGWAACRRTRRPSAVAVTDRGSPAPELLQQPLAERVADAQRASPARCAVSAALQGEQVGGSPIPARRWRRRAGGTTPRLLRRRCSAGPRPRLRTWPRPGPASAPARSSAFGMLRPVPVLERLCPRGRARSAASPCRGRACRP